MRIVIRLLLAGLVFFTATANAQTLQFARQLGSTGAEQVNGISTNSGKTYVCGSYTNAAAAPTQTDFDPGAATVNGPGSSGIDQFWCGSYDATGAYSKVFTIYNNSTNKPSRAISADVSGNYAVTGAIAGTGYFGG